MEIFEHTTLKMENVLSYRGKVTQQELAVKSREIEQIIRDAGAKKNGATATTTFSVEQSAQGVIMDVE